jgi:hypothetical protein
MNSISSPVGQPDTLELTVVQSKSLLTKSYKISADGSPTKAKEPNLPNGSAKRHRLKLATWHQEFAALLGALEPTECLILGKMRALGDERPIVTRANLTASNKPNGAITRTTDNFSYEPGAPAIFGLDFDAKDIPDPLRDRLEKAGGIRAVLDKMLPGFPGIALVQRPSVSAGIRAAASGKETPGGGVHIYFAIKDGADAAAFTERLHARLVSDGWGWAYITSAGTVSIRSLVDTAASGHGERLWFEADAFLDTGLSYKPDSRKIEVRPGDIFDAASLANLDGTEQVELRNIEAKLKSDVEPARAKTRAAWEQERSQELVAKGVALDEAKRRVAAWGKGAPLDSGVPLIFDDGRTVEVADVLADPEKFKGAKLRDPLEPDYSGGRPNMAVLRVFGGRPLIFSQAHGGQKFALAWSMDDLRSAYADAKAKGDDPAAVIRRMAPLASISDADRALFRQEFGEAYGEIIADEFVSSDRAWLASWQSLPLPTSIDEQRLELCVSEGLLLEINDAIDGIEIFGTPNIDAGKLRQIVAGARSLATLPQQSKYSQRKRLEIDANYSVTPVKKRLWVTSWLQKGHVSFLAAEPGAGKSNQMLLTAVAIATDKPSLIGETKFENSGAVVIVSAEDDMDENQRRLHAIFRLHNINIQSDARYPVSIISLPSGSLFGRQNQHDVPRELAGAASVREVLSAKLANGPAGVCLVAFDTLAASLAGLDENSAPDMQAAMDFFRGIAEQYGCAVAVVHHVSKAASGNTGSQFSLRGSGALVGAARNVMTLARAPERGWVTLQSVKSNYGPTGEVRNFKFEEVKVQACDPQNSNSLETETVGALSFQPNGIPSKTLSAVSHPMHDKILKTIAAGVGGDPARPFSDTKNSGQRCVFAMLEREFKMPKVGARNHIAGLLEAGVLKVEDVRLDGKDRKALRVTAQPCSNSDAAAETSS